MPPLGRCTPRLIWQTLRLRAEDFGYLEAGAVIAMIPCVVLYIALQRYYIRGLTSGVVKG